MASFAMRGRVAILRIAKPPINSLGLAVRQGLARGLDEAEAAGAKAVVIAGEGATFPAGADITEFAAGGHLTKPTLNDIIERISALPMHSVAAIHGTALGGGMEVTLACTHRLVHEGAKLGLPEVHLGILPGAGGTQRLPRLVGCEKAIQMMTSGAPIGAKAALAAQLCDETVPADAAAPADTVLEAAVAYAEQHLVDAPWDPSRVVANRKLEDPGADFFTAAKQAVAAKAKGEVAPLKIVDMVAAAVSAPTFEDGLKAETTGFLELASGEQAKALQQVFFAERKISKIDGLGADVKPAKVTSAAVIGAGTMGGGIAMCFADAGIDVTLVDMSSEAVERGVAIIRSNYEATAKKGRMSEAQVEARMGRITPASSYDHPGLANADVVVEAAFETMDVKRQVFGMLDKHCKPSALLATNTSTLSIDEIGAATARPESVVGMHFFSPANVMPLLENVRSDASSDVSVATAMALGKKLKKKAVLARSCFGFIGNRMLEPYVQEALYQLEEGCLPKDVDAAIGPKGFGMAMGPFTMSDLAGNDIGAFVRRELGWIDGANAAEPNRRYWASIADELVARGRLGQKTKKGWYDYSAGRKPVDDPKVEAMVLEVTKKLGIERSAPGSSTEILDRCLLPLVNEGFKILEEGIAQRESDINIVWLYGYGFPRKSGGPMHWARHIRPGGLPKIVEDLRTFAAAHPTVPHWEPCALLVQEAAATSKL